MTEALYRACHTLSGIAKTAGARQGIKVAEPMEHYVRKLYDSGHGLPEEGLALLRDPVRSLENVVEHVDEDTGFFPDHGRLIAGWHALDRSLDAELAQLTEAAERTVAALWPPPEAAAPAVPAMPAEELTEPSLPSLVERVEMPAEVDRDLTAPHVLLAPLPPEAEAREAAPPAVEEPAVEAVQVAAIAAPAEIAPEPEHEPEHEPDRQFRGVFSEMFLVSATLDAGSVADGAGETQTIAVPGVALGDIVLGVSLGVDLVDMTVTGYVQAANAVEVRIQNESGAGPVDLASTTIKLVVARPAF